ncbi:ABC transporter permease [Pseudoalteromonas umbrosa]|uniref:ABC transporter permease n=1 Tax=Pseudoalteromonas umbrosa TaxID=3048489 RepID=UPI0024C26837|nr:ABC transporter permease [Pseudoalteromonas sp. B95]MDK1290572.1 ABC transporter permease [Pseudoalteromonas sp. B95]
MNMMQENISSIKALFNKLRFTVLFVVLLASALAGGALVSLIAWHAYAPLPYAQPDQLIWLHGSMVDDKDSVVMDKALSNVAAQYIAQHDTRLSMATPLHYGDALYMNHTSQPKLNLTYAEPAFFTLFEQELLQGRYFGQGQSEGAIPFEAVVSECFAKRYMPQLLEQQNHKQVYSMQLDQQTFQVVGVVACTQTEPQIYMPNRYTDVYVSFGHTIDSHAMSQAHISVRYNTFVVGRSATAQIGQPISPDMTAYLDAQFRAGLVDFGSALNNHVRFEYDALKQYLKGDIQQSSDWLLLSGGAFLLITLINLLTFYLLDIKKQQAHLVLKSTLGAPLSTLRLAHYWQVIVLFLLSAMCAAVLVELGIFAIQMFGAQSIAHLDWLQVNLLHYVIIFAVAIVLALGFAVFGFKQLPFTSLYQNLQGAGKGQEKQLPQWFSVTILVTQLSIGMVVLCIGTWSANYFGSQVQTPSGIDAEDTVFVVRHQLSWRQDDVAIAERKQLFLSNIRALSSHPKVAAVALSSLNPLDTSYLAQIGKQPVKSAQVTMHSQLVGEDYFSLLGLHFIAGDTFTRLDSARRESVIINRAAAEMLDIEVEDIGLSLYGRSGQPIRLLGIVENIYSHGKGAPATVYFPHDYYEGNMVVRFKSNQSMSKLELSQVLQQQVNSQSVREVTDLTHHLSGLNQAAVLSFYSGLGLSFLMIMQVLVGLYGLLGNLALAQQPVLLIKQQVGATRLQLLTEQMHCRLVHFGVAMLIATSVTLGLGVFLPMTVSSLLFNYLCSLVIVFIMLFIIEINHLRGQLKKY